MLTRPGSEPGPAWMRELALDPRRLRKAILRIIIFFGIIQIGAVIAGDIAVYRAHGRHISSYNSPIQVAGMPLLSIGGRAHGIIAYGGIATGIVAIGGVTAGVITFGGVGIGFFSFGGLSIAVIAAGGVAIGWRAMGGLAIGEAALGGTGHWQVRLCGERHRAGAGRGKRSAERKSLWMSLLFKEKSVRTLLKSGIAQLRDAQVPSYTLAAELLLLHVLGRDRTWIYSHPEEEIVAPVAEQYSVLIRRRAAGEPTQHLTGKQEFWGLELEVTPDVLIPRPETEHVIEVALDRLGVRELRAGRRQPLSGEGLRIADVGTGSGCIAIALAKALPLATFFAMDISDAALEVARRNAERHGVFDRILFFQSNLLEDLCAHKPGVKVFFDRTPAPPTEPTPTLRCDALPDGDPVSFGVPQPLSGPLLSPFRFDLIVSNPPYVGRREAATLMREVREHEPEIALYGGEEGYELYAGLIAQSAKCLLPHGILVLELGHNSMPAVQPLLDESIWTKVGVTNDLAGIPRVLAAERSD